MSIAAQLAHLRGAFRRHVWSIEELIDAALSAEPYEPPEPRPLAPRPDAPKVTTKLRARVSA